MQRTKDTKAAADAFEESLTQRAAAYRRERGWLALGWAIVALGALFNLLAAIQAM